MSVSLNFVGDFCLGNLEGLRFGDQLTALLQKADANVVNLEASVRASGSMPQKKSGPHLCQDNRVPSFLEEHGFSVIAMANNHIMDYGEESLIYTMGLFNKSVIVGAGTFDEAYNIKTIDTGECVIGFLSLSQYEFGIVENDRQKGAAWLFHPVVDELITTAHQSCDVLIVLPHAGLENFEYPLPVFRDLYRHFIRMGADAVIGGHPHVPQNWEFYCGKPIVYSLGNFCFDMHGKGNSWYKGILANLVITKKDIQLQILPVEYDVFHKCVDINNAPDFVSHLKVLCQSFHNESLYLSNVDKRCLLLKPTYISYFEWAGFFCPSLKKYTRLLLGLIKRKLLRMRTMEFEEAHFINSIRCETHRFVLSRIYDIEHGRQ